MYNGKLISVCCNNLVLKNNFSYILKEKSICYYIQRILITYIFWTTLYMHIWNTYWNPNAVQRIGGYFINSKYALTSIIIDFDRTVNFDVVRYLYDFVWQIPSECWPGSQGAWRVSISEDRTLWYFICLHILLSVVKKMARIEMLRYILRCHSHLGNGFVDYLRCALVVSFSDITFIWGNLKPCMWWLIVANDSLMKSVTFDVLCQRCVLLTV